MTTIHNNNSQQQNKSNIFGEAKQYLMNLITKEEENETNVENVLLLKKTEAKGNNNHDDDHFVKRKITTIDCLNEDCLRYLLFNCETKYNQKYFTNNELIHLRCVSTLWKQLIENHFASRTTTLSLFFWKNSFDLVSFHFDYPDYETNQQNVPHQQTPKMNNKNHNVRLTLHENRNNNSEALVQLLGRLFPNIHSLMVHSEDAQSNSITGKKTLLVDLLNNGWDTKLYQLKLYGIRAPNICWSSVIKKLFTAIANCSSLRELYLFDIHKKKDEHLQKIAIRMLVNIDDAYINEDHKEISHLFGLVPFPEQLERFGLFYKSDSKRYTHYSVPNLGPNIRQLILQEVDLDGRRIHQIIDHCPALATNLQTLIINTIRYPHWIDRHTIVGGEKQYFRNKVSCFNAICDRLIGLRCLDLSFLNNDTLPLSVITATLTQLPNLIQLFLPTTHLIRSVNVKVNGGDEVAPIVALKVINSLTPLKSLRLVNFHSTNSFSLNYLPQLVNQTFPSINTVTLDNFDTEELADFIQNIFEKYNNSNNQINTNKTNKRILCDSSQEISSKLIFKKDKVNILTFERNVCKIKYLKNLVD